MDKSVIKAKIKHAAMIDTRIQVTVGIPCFNCQRHISRILEALAEQSYPPTQIIIVDDGSKPRITIDTGDNEDIKLIRHERNLGVAAARNSIIESALGEIIVFVDSDAYPKNDYIENLVESFDAVCIAGVGGRLVEGELKTIADRWRAWHYDAQTWGLEQLDDVPFIFGGASAYRKSILEKVAGFDPQFATNAEDVDIAFRIRAYGYRLAYNPNAIALHQRSDKVGTLISMSRRYHAGAAKATWKNRAGGLQKVLVIMFSQFIKSAHHDIAIRPSLVQLILTFIIFLSDCQAAIIEFAKLRGIDKKRLSGDIEDISFGILSGKIYIPFTYPEHDFNRLIEILNKSPLGSDCTVHVLMTSSERENLDNLPADVEIIDPDIYGSSKYSRLTKLAKAMRDDAIEAFILPLSSSDAGDHLFYRTLGILGRPRHYLEIKDTNKAAYFTPNKRILRLSLLLFCKPFRVLLDLAIALPAVAMIGIFFAFKNRSRKTSTLRSH